MLTNVYGENQFESLNACVKNVLLILARNEKTKVTSYVNNQEL